MIAEFDMKLNIQQQILTAIFSLFWYLSHIGILLNCYGDSSHIMTTTKIK